MHSDVTVLLAAVLSASFVGSLHCVGMCGPLALWASGAERNESVWSHSLAVGLYHGGRLWTYAIVGAIAGGLGGLLDRGGMMLGVQLMAAKIAGILMIVLGLRVFWQFIQTRFTQQDTSILFSPATSTNPTPNWFHRTLVQFRPTVLNLPLSTRGFITGLLTAFLPCGWLYVFAIVAAGTGTAWLGALTMAAFWLGTVPALVAAVASAQSVTKSLRGLSPILIGLAMVWTGGSLFAGRGFAHLSSLDEVLSDSEQARIESMANVSEGDALPDLQQTPLPCCQHHE